MPTRAKLIGVKAMLERVTIAKVDLSASGCSYRLWRESKRGGDPILVAEIHRGHIFDHLGRYTGNDVSDDSEYLLP